MSWLSLTIIAQILNSIVAIFDKYLVTSKRVTTPTLYVFYTGVLAFLGILIYIPALFTPNLPLPKFSNIEILSSGLFVTLIFACILQLIALWGLFSSLKKNDASDVVPVIGSFSAIIALLVGYLFFNLALPFHFTIGFTLLVFGTAFISHMRFSKKTVLLVLLSGASFALYNILLKEVIVSTSFDTGFFWMTIFTTIFSLTLLFSKKIRAAFHTNRKERHIKTTGTVLFLSKILAGVAGILLIKAAELGEVSLVQSLGGLQFVFLFLFAVIIGPLTPVDFGENIKRKDLYIKLVAITIIVLGFVLLFI